MIKLLKLLIVLCVLAILPAIFSGKPMLAVGLFVATLVLRIVLWVANDHV